MRIFKFGGASVKSADAVRNVGRILESNNNGIVVVISAMGKTTNLLEKLVKFYFDKNNSKWEVFEQFKSFHTEICDQLFGAGKIPETVNDFYLELQAKLRKSPSLDFNFEYDQVVSFGELVSTRIVSEYLNAAGIKNRWVDARDCIRTDDTFRDASIDWELTEKLSKEIFSFNEYSIYLTQGFIGSTTSSLTTTLGREGSDFTAGILGNVLDAESVSFWKAVPGVISAYTK